MNPLAAVGESTRIVPVSDHHGHPFPFPPNMVPVPMSSIPNMPPMSMQSMQNIPTLPMSMQTMQNIIPSPQSKVKPNNMCPIEGCDNLKEKNRSLCARHRKQKYKGTLEEAYIPPAKKRKLYKDWKNKSEFLSRVRERLLEFLGEDEDIRTVLMDLLTKTQWGKQQKEDIPEKNVEMMEDLLKDLRNCISVLPKGSPVKKWLLGSVGVQYTSEEIAQLFNCNARTIRNNRNRDHSWIKNLKSNKSKS